MLCTSGKKGAKSRIYEQIAKYLTADNSVEQVENVNIKHYIKHSSP
jgi:hypothetical protein